MQEQLAAPLEEQTIVEVDNESDSENGSLRESKFAYFKNKTTGCI